MAGSSLRLVVCVCICSIVGQYGWGEEVSALDLYNRGAMADQQHELEEAAKLYKQALDRDPRLLDACAALAWTQLLRKEIADAVQHFGRLTHCDDGLLRAEGVGALRGVPARGQENPAAVPGAEFVGDMEEGKVHRRTCAAVKSRPPYLLLPFDSVEAAIDAGYKPCVDCRCDPNDYYAHIQRAQSQAAKRNEMRQRSLISRALMAQRKAAQEQATVVSYSSGADALHAEATRILRNIGSGTILADQLGLEISTERQKQRLHEAVNCEKVAAYFEQRAAGHEASAEWQGAHAQKMQKRLVKVRQEIAEQEETEEVGVIRAQANACIARAAELSVAGDFLNALQTAVLIPEIIPEEYPEVASEYGYGAFQAVQRIAHMFYLRGREAWGEDDILLALTDWGNALALVKDDPLYTEAVRKADDEIKRRTAAQVAEKLLQEADVKWREGNRDKAIELYVQCSEVAPDNWADVQKLREAMQKAAGTIAGEAANAAKEGDFADAVDLYEVALGLAPHDEGVKQGLSTTRSECSAALERTGDQAFGRRDYVTAADAYSKVLEVTPDRGELREKLNVAQSGSRQVVAVRPAITHPWDCQAQVDALEACRGLGDFSLAVRELEAEVAHPTEPNLNLLLLANLQSVAGDTSAAQGALVTWCSAKGRQTGATLRDEREEIVKLGSVNVPTTDEAERCAGEHTNDPLAAVLLASVHLERGHSREFRSVMGQLLEERPNFGPAQLLASYATFLASAAPKGASREDVLPALSHALWAARLDPQNHLTCLQCAAMYLIGGGVREAECYLSQAEALAPDEARCAMLRAIVHLRKEEPDEALEVIEQLLEHDMYPASAHYLAACAYVLKNVPWKVRLEMGRATRHERSYYAVRKPDLRKGIVRIVRELIPSTPEFIRSCATSTVREDLAKVEQLPQELLFCISGPRESEREGG